MSNEGERTCPLCAEEMDLTDQQLKPCKCGYEICVWCWHHIMDMAEKDNTEGRCPACRTPYNKEKIVETASKCERLVNGTSVEKKQKTQKGKTKTLEGKNQLGNVRVIQRNLVYVVGLPLDLADEDLLQQKEYFGQYGKVLKVSISRTAAGAIQQFANSTCSVYITYSKEEEAVRSIQSAHGFILEGRPLRACFGTTKYCHAWLRNTPCTNADCLYLHEFGQQEDSFTKDEIVSAYTRVQQITGATNDMQRRSGNLLPPPVDDISNNSTSAWPKPISKSTTNNPANSMKVSPPNSSSGRSVALPAAASWGTRSSNNQPIVTNVASSNKPSSQQADVNKHSEKNKNVQEKGNLVNPVSIKKVVGQVSKTSPKNKNTSKHHSKPVLDKDSNVADVARIDDSRLQPSKAEEFAKPLASNEVENTAKQSDLVSDLQKKVAKIAISEAEQDLLSFNDQRLGDQEIATQHAFNEPLVNEGTFEASGPHSTGLDLGENSIISNILSMDFDPWDESLTSPRNLAKFLGESDTQRESNRVLSSRKTPNSNQSRFSFAREEECTYQESNYAPNASDFGRGFVSNNRIYVDNKMSNGNGFSSFSFEESDHFASNYSHVSENKIPVQTVSRTQVSAPPGFSGPNRAPPPGFTSNERMQQTYDKISGKYMINGSTLPRKTHQTTSFSSTPVNIGDLEFMDPAILAVGGRLPSDINMRSNFPSQLNSFENDIRLQLLMQTSYSQQNPRFDNYGIPSRMVENNISAYQQPMTSFNVNGHLNGWNEVIQGGNERMGFDKYYVNGHQDTTYQLPTSRDMYKTTFGI